MSLWNVLLQFLDGEPALFAADIVVWNNQIDAKSFPGTFLRDFFESPVQFLGFHASRAKHTEPASFGHRTHNRRTMTEGKNGDIHTINITECVMHCISPGIRT